MSLTNDPELKDIQTRLSSPDSEVRRIALLDIADFEGDDHLPLIIASLKDPVAAVRAQGAKALEEALEASEDDVGIQALIVALEDPDPLVREAAAHSLHDLKQQESVRSILPHLAHPEALVRATLFRALRGLRVTESFTPALAALSDNNAEVRREAVAVLGYLKQPRALPALATLAAGDPEAEVRRAAIGAIGFASDDTILLHC